MKEKTAQARRSSRRQIPPGLRSVFPLFLRFSPFYSVFHSFIVFFSLFFCDFQSENAAISDFQSENAAIVPLFSCISIRNEGKTAQKEEFIRAKYEAKKFIGSVDTAMVAAGNS